MATSQTLTITEQSWVIDMPVKFARALGVAEGSMAVLYVKEGKLEVEILPPPTPELKKAAHRIQSKYGEAFKEMKRLGD